jgi:hypothetical protein
MKYASAATITHKIFAILRVVFVLRSPLEEEVTAEERSC